MRVADESVVASAEEAYSRPTFIIAADLPRTSFFVRPVPQGRRYSSLYVRPSVESAVQGPERSRAAWTPPIIGNFLFRVVMVALCNRADHYIFAL